MVAAEAAAAGVPPVVADHSGLAEVAAGIAAEYPPELAQLRRSRAAMPPRSRERLRELLALPRGAERPRPRGAPRRRAQLELDAGGRAAARATRNRARLSPVGDEQKIGYEELLAASKAAFEEVPDFTVAVEEEFALLDPATLGLVNRFEDVQQAAAGTDLEPHLVGELIASEVEVRTGRCDTLRRLHGARRRASRAASRARRSARHRALVDRHASLEPVAGTADHRHAALPAQQRVPALRRLAEQHVRVARARRHQRRRPRDPRVQRASQLPAGAARGLGELAVRRGCVHVSPLRAHAGVHAHVPALRHPRLVRGLGRLGAVSSTPHYRRNDELLRYVVWRNNTFGLHVHVGINNPDRAIRVCSALRNYLPELLAVSASSPFVEGVFTYLHSARTQIFTRMFPRCGIPDWFEGWDDWESYVRFLYETGSVTEHTQIWWSVRPHLEFPTVEIRICDAQPELAEARSLVALIYSLTARIARALDEGEPLPVVAAPAARGEPLARDPPRAVGRADRLRARRVDPRARAHRAARRVGAAGRRRARRLAVARGPGAERRGAADRPPRGGRVDGGDLHRTGSGR